MNGEIILLSDLNQQIATMRRFKEQGVVQIPEESLTQEAVLQNFIDEKIITYYARFKNLSVTQTEIDQAIERVKTQNKMTDETLKMTLKQQGTSLEKYRETLEKQLLIQKVSGVEVPPVPATQKEVEEYYNRHRERFVKSGRIRASHIVLLATEDSGEGEVEQAREKIEKIMDELRNGTDFAETAATYSQDGSAKKGGDLGWFSRGEMLQDFEDKAFALDVGEIGGPVHTQFGFHIIKVTDKEKAALLPLDEVSKEIGQKLQNDSYQVRRRAWMERLREQSYIEILY